MKHKKTWVAASAFVVATLGVAGTIAATTADDSEAPITGPALEKASAAALAHTKGGTVTDTEVGDEESYYEVEVTLSGGGRVDVQLDENFAVVGSSADEGDDDKD